ncbi:MAG: peptidase C69 [Deltaproteobacteria bacterium GWC2_42_51]|nr:MAG: peptidase C69 [Deltaproteobacteria bacterium GWA2_42_85]OGP31824.1 MAG: peptidase C69 [Deltaproteobacteria bacterium GWC2_42_51]OGP38042.1 MAG: peptidase C69 [Deltaproteobacteria bacterium GWD2_42_10]OGP47622.1 MAG: peptidase C69 [Deltaproteobacteria bacterium GWF2_42_12]OGQ30328.1 MAG: peptidase C69 [Deltaproteobacteria bacterium RIFCSPHIGHO2_02_FULL_42_44]OGQ35628.1 MAG: peptidase C69 [Deltaproteobacteria bacterium RIFCSPLOWO2_02_FULL_42_39]OGQ64394.1 MAG: peptidase C69 [Deltaproteo
MKLIKDFNPLNILKRALQHGGDFADIYMEETFNTSIICEDNKIEKVVSGRDRGIGLRVIFDFKTAYAYTNDLTEKGLLELADTVSKAVKEGGSGKDIGLVKKEIAPGFSIKVPPQSVDLLEKVELVKKANTFARGFDNRIGQVKVVYGDGFRQMVVVNSYGQWAEEDRIGILFLVQVVAREGDVVQTGYEPVGGVMGLEIFEETPPEKVAELASKRALLMLKARKAEGGKMSVVLSNEAGGTMIHEAVGHGLEADLAQQGLSVYSGKIGEKIASPLVTVIDDATIPYRRGSFFFDDEGTHGQKTILVENGVLKNYMYDRLTALKDGAVSTGNGRRESYHHRPIPRMTNTMIAPGKTNPEDIIKSLGNGLFVKKMGGGQVNTVNGDFVFEITEGYLIEKGKIGEPVRGATLTGNGPQILKNIDMVGSDLGFAIGTCGKDAQGVPVSDAQPTLRIPEIVIGGEVK